LNLEEMLLAQISLVRKTGIAEILRVMRYSCRNGAAINIHAAVQSAHRNAWAIPASNRWQTPIPKPVPATQK